MKKIVQISLIISISLAVGNYAYSQNYYFNKADNDWIEVSKKFLRSSLRNPAQAKKYIDHPIVIIDENIRAEYIYKQMRKATPRLTDTQGKRNSFIARAYGHFASISSWKKNYEDLTGDLPAKPPKIRFNFSQNRTATVNRYIKNGEINETNDIVDSESSAIFIKSSPIDTVRESEYEVLYQHNTYSILSASNGTESKLYSIIGWWFKK